MSGRSVSAIGSAGCSMARLHEAAPLGSAPLGCVVPLRGLLFWGASSRGLLALFPGCISSLLARRFAGASSCAESSGVHLQASAFRGIFVGSIFGCGSSDGVSSRHLRGRRLRAPLGGRPRWMADKSSCLIGTQRLCGCADLQCVLEIKYLRYRGVYGFAD